MSRFGHSQGGILVQRLLRDFIPKLAPDYLHAAVLSATVPISSLGAGFAMMNHKTNVFKEYAAFALKAIFFIFFSLTKRPSFFCFLFLKSQGTALWPSCSTFSPVECGTPPWFNVCSCCQALNPSRWRGAKSVMCNVCWRRPAMDGLLLNTPFGSDRAFQSCLRSPSCCWGLKMM